MKLISLMVVGLSTAALMGCAPATPAGLFDKGGITTKPGPALVQNAVLPMDELQNHVVNPEHNRLFLGQFCGHLIKNEGKTSDKKDKGYSPLLIQAFGASKPLVTTPANEENSYHSLIDSGGSASLNAAWAIAGGGFSVAGQDRLEVTVSTLSYCQAASFDADAIKKALPQLQITGINTNEVAFVVSAVLTRMTVNHLIAITADAKLAVTPIVNFGGQNYSKIDSTRLRHYITLQVVPLAAVLAAKPGDAVAAMPLANAIPTDSTVVINVTANPANVATQVLAPAAFKSGVQAVKGALVKAQ